MPFYVDSCIYINLWQAEINRKYQPLWKFALDFLEHVEKLNEVIYVSGFVVKELGFVLELEEFKQKIVLFEDESRFKRVIATQEDYEAGRRLESASNFDISFYDCMHVVLSRRLNAILITRDNKLLDFARNYCQTARPEEIVKTG